MSFFTDAQDFEIHGGQFASTTNITNNSNGPTGIDILREASAPEAAHDSNARSSPPRCFPGTREQYLEDIVQWALPAIDDASLPLLWMKGPAGVGKSAVAQTCADKLRHIERLGAAFFFSINGRDKPGTLFPSIAYQLATIHSAYRNLIDRKIRQDHTLVDKTMESQFHGLIAGPLLELEADGKGIGKRIPIFVDGLDECQGIDAQCEIIRVVALAARSSAIPLCWAFFSRPEPHIEAAFAAANVTRYTHQVMLPISRNANGEIELYLRAGFGNMLQRRNLLMPSPWPSDGDMKTLVDAASGSFIYATTVLRFVAHLDALGPEKRLRMIIDVILERTRQSSSASEMPFAELDAFYTPIMQRIPSEMLQSVQLVLGRLCRFFPWSAAMLANITRLSRIELDNICNQMSSVIHFRDAGHTIRFDPTIDTTRPYTEINQSFLPQLSHTVQFRLGGMVSFYHKSFADFLIDPKRSGCFTIKDIPALTRHATDLHLDYDRSYGWKGSDLALNPSFPDSASSLSDPSTNELVNSLLKAWVYRCVAGRFARKLYYPTENKKEIDCDHRKNLYIVTSIWRTLNHNPSAPFPSRFWDYASHSRAIPGTQITWLRGSEFRKLNLAEFKEIIEQREQTKFIRRCYIDFGARLKSLLPRKSDENFESALYRVGWGEKSIYWFWEINHTLEYYREFQTIDLTQGQEMYRQENYDSWPRHVKRL